MDCWESAECLEGCRVGWMAPSRRGGGLNSCEDNRKPGVAVYPKGYREQRGHPRDQEGVKQQGGRRVTRMVRNSEWSESRQEHWIAPTSQERASPNARARCSMCEAVLDTQGRC